MSDRPPKATLSVTTRRHPDPECAELIRKIEGAMACGAAEIETDCRAKLDARLAVWLPEHKARLARGEV